MKPIIRHLFAAALFITVPVGCGSKEDAKKDESEKKDEDEKKKGLEAEGNDEDIVKLAKKILDCDWKGGKPPSSSKCEDYKEWSKGELFKDNDEAEDTLLNFLDDDEENVRYLAATALASRGDAYHEDKKMAKRVVEALEDEKEEAAAERLASAVADIDFEKVGMVDEAIELMKDHGVLKARARLVNDIMFSNRDSKKLYEHNKTAAKEAKEEEIRSAAVSGFWVGTPRDKKGEVCALWREVAETDEAPKVGEQAFRLAGQKPTKGCEEEYDALIALADKKAKAGEVETGDIGSGLGYIAGQKGIAGPTKSKALAAAKALLANDANEGIARSAALRVLGEHDPSGKTLATKYKDDKEFFVKSTAKRILEGKIELKK